jgi:integrase/recombinase XerD
MMRYFECNMNDQKRDFKPAWEITRDMFLSEEEIARLLAHVGAVEPGANERRKAQAARDRLLIEALLFSGLRNSEFCGLRVRDTIVGTGESVFLVRGTPRQDRTVHVPEALSLLVQQFVHVHREILVRRQRGGVKSSDALIINDRGRPFERTSLYRRVVGILTAAGLGERASVQFLRHTYGYLAYKQSGGNLLFVQRQMGHAHPMVSSVYSQFVEESYPDLANRIAMGSASAKLRAGKLTEGVPGAAASKVAAPNRKRENTDADRKRSAGRRASRNR